MVAAHKAYELNELHTKMIKVIDFKLQELTVS